MYRKLFLCNSENDDIGWCNKNNSKCFFFCFPLKNNKIVFLFKKPKKQVCFFFLNKPRWVVSSWKNVGFSQPCASLTLPSTTPCELWLNACILNLADYLPIQRAELRHKGATLSLACCAINVHVASRVDHQWNVKWADNTTRHCTFPSPALARNDPSKNTMGLA